MYLSDKDNFIIEDLIAISKIKGELLKSSMHVYAIIEDMVLFIFVLYLFWSVKLTSSPHQSEIKTKQVNFTYFRINVKWI